MLLLQEESMKLLHATQHGNIELISKFIDDGIDMNYLAGDEVCTPYIHIIYVACVTNLAKPPI